VSGITATSPALAVASSSGKLAFSAYREGHYEIQTLEQASAESAPIVTAGVATKPPAGTLGNLAELLSNAHIGLPSDGAFRTSKYDNRLRVESIADPYVGAAVGGGMVGGVLRASVGITFGDMLRDRLLQTMLRVGRGRTILRPRSDTSTARGGSTGLRRRVRSRAVRRRAPLDRSH